MGRGARTSVYDGKQFDSQLEVGAYRLLQMMKIEFTFHENKYTLLEGYTVHAYSQQTKKVYKSKVGGMTYTPEFIIPAPEGIELIIEMKGHMEPAFRIKWKIFKSKLEPHQRAFIVKSNGDLVHILEIYGVQGRVDRDKLQQQFDL